MWARPREGEHSRHGVQQHVGLGEPVRDAHLEYVGHACRGQFEHVGVTAARVPSACIHSNGLRSPGLPCERMLPSGDIYNSARLAAGYAFARPPVHPRVIASCRRTRDFRRPPCGARARRGLRRRAFDGGARRARRHGGRDRACRPACSCTVARSRRAPRSSWGRPSTSPSPTASFDLVTAAGALNYTDRDRSLAEIARVLVRQAACSHLRLLQRTPVPRGASLDAWFARVRAALSVSARVCHGRAGARLRARGPAARGVRAVRGRLCRSRSKHIWPTCSAKRTSSAPSRSGVPETDIAHMVPRIPGLRVRLLDAVGALHRIHRLRGWRRTSTRRAAPRL